MRKTVLLFVFLASTTFVKAQEPTKEQTIKWIKENIELYYSQGTIRKLEVTPCQITYYNGDNYIVAPVRADIHLGIEDEAVAIKYDNERKAKLVIRDDGERDSFDNLITLVDDNHIDIGNRMLKALKHLATFCTKEESPF